MSLISPTEFTEMSAANVLKQTKSMSPEKFTEFVVNARLKQRDGIARTPLEEVLCDAQIETRVTALRKLSGRVMSNVIYASQARELAQVQSANVFKDTWKKLKVTIHDTKILTPSIPRCGEGNNQVTLETFLVCKELNQSVSLFLPGKSRTGKTELAKLLCLNLACRYQADDGDAKFIMVNTLDSLRSVQGCMLPSVPVLLDDIGSGDSNDQQLIYSNISMWKAILQVANASQNRARNDDISWSQKQPKIVTTNCENLNDWVASMFSTSRENHKEAIRMRVAEVEAINESLFANSYAPTVSQRFVEPRFNSQQVDDILARLLDK